MKNADLALAAVLDAIRPGTRTFPVSIAEIQLRTRLTERGIKDAVRTLRERQEPIGAGRGRVSGYYLIRDRDDADAAVAPLWRQAISELRTIRQMLGPHRYREMAGQELLKVEE